MEDRQRARAMVKLYGYLSITLTWLSIPTCCSFMVPQTHLGSFGRDQGIIVSLASILSDLEATDLVGSGSYGTVYRLSGGATEEFIGKRPWSVRELQENNTGMSADLAETRAETCLGYWKIERHCLQKLKGVEGVPVLTGVQKNRRGNEWMVFEIETSAPRDSKTIAPSLHDLMQRDLKDRKVHNEHHLYLLAQALELESASSSNNENEGTVSLAETLDVVLEQMLTILKKVHAKKIVHRDIKPANLLVTSSGKLVLIDFGSAADIETAGLLRQNIGLSDTVAISPIYAAPELFVDPGRSPEKFDCFSAALLYCQLLFQYLDERTDAGFRQQLESAGWSLDTWLQNELQAKVRPAGLDDALEVLSDRPGLWDLLRGLLHEDPADRLSAGRALELFKRIQLGKTSREVDGTFLSEVLESTESCLVGPMIRPLHFVATFARSQSLGLILSESDVNIDEFDDADAETWIQMTEDSFPGEVFVKGLVPGGQAESMGVFEVGDRLQGVGELPLAEGGFEKAVAMIQDQPRNSKNVRLHFDRKSASATLPGNSVTSTSFLKGGRDGSMMVTDQGAWSSKGRRSAQEDAFILTEVLSTAQGEQPCILLAGIFDGHLGTAASTFIHDEFPAYFSNTLETKTTLLETSNENTPLSEILEVAWETTCQAYRAGCNQSETECVADYDNREGILIANTASETAVAGSTAVAAAFNQESGVISLLNCGDSRGVVLDSNLGKIIFSTVDHKPETDAERLSRGRAEGKDYNLPECRLSRWFLPVGDYEYAVSRSLEGPFTTSKGIVSDADVTDIPVCSGSTTVLLASDGLWEVVDTAEACRILQRLRETNASASDAAKTLSSIALEKGSSDNVSAVVIYLN